MSRLKEPPFYRTNITTQKIMRDVLISLIPIIVMSVYYFGIGSLILISTGIISAVLFEYGFQKLTNQSTKIKDLSAAVTGCLVGLSYPITAPIWIVLLGSFIAIFVKEISGGIGKNTFNPAVFSRVFIKIILTPYMTNWVTPLPDMVSTATPLEFIGNGKNFIESGAPQFMDVFMGNIGGGIGETVKWAILLGLVYLVYRKVIRLEVPVAAILGLFFTTLLFGKSDYQYAFYHVISGTFLFAAVFMVTDYTSGPLNPRGRIYYAIGIGVLTGIIRYVFNLPGGVGISILIMNILAPLIDAFTVPKVFGHKSSSVLYENRK